MVSHKILFFFHWKAQLFNLMKHQKINVSHILSVIQNVRQHHFETSKGFIFDYAMHKNITFVILAHSSQTTLHRKIIYHFVWIYLGQHCIHKEITCTMLAWSTQIYIHRKINPSFSHMSGDLFFKLSNLGFLFNVSSWVHLWLAGQQWTGTNIDWNNTMVVL